MSLIRYCFACLLVLALCGPAAAQNREELKAAMAELLRENPDLVFDVLRAHNDVLYDLAMQGREVRIIKDFQTQWTQDLTVPKQLDFTGDPARGPEDAPVTIVAFSDFTCAYCQRAAITIEQLLGVYGAKIRFIFKAVPHDPEGVNTSRRAAEYFYAAYAINPANAWKFYALVFSSQQNLLRDSESYLRQAWVEAGFDASTIARATNARAIGEQLARNKEESQRYKLQGTPCFFINDMVIMGAQPAEVFSAAIERALRETARR